jgi:hypothetical protein
MMERKRPTKVVKTVKKDEPMNVAKKLVGKQMSHVLRGESDARVVRMSTYFNNIHTHTNINLLTSSLHSQNCMQRFRHQSLFRSIRERKQSGSRTASESQERKAQGRY